MVTDKETIERIREVIDKHYNRLIVSVLGSELISKDKLKELQTSGYDIKSNELMELIYNHNFINTTGDEVGPTSVPDMRNQQKVPAVIPKGEAHDFAIENLNETTAHYINKMKTDVASRIEGIVRQNNQEYKMDALQNLERSEFADRLMKESSLGKVKQKLKATSKDANRDWQRVALTEMGNAIGIGSVDRIVSQNQDKNLQEIYVYRIPVNDSKTCKYCRRFYNSDSTGYKIYRLSTLLANGSNYGKKSDQWKPTIMSTHPNSRTSQVIEIPPGWSIASGGKLTYIGLDKWDDYIRENLVS